MEGDRIRALNDEFRKSFVGGRVMLTQGVAALPLSVQQSLVKMVQNFDQFDSGNDPHGEHDFGAVELDGTKYFFKLDYYDPTLTYGSEDASDPNKTVRVLTIMRADEY